MLSRLKKFTIFSMAEELALPAVDGDLFVFTLDLNDGTTIVRKKVQAARMADQFADVCFFICFIIHFSAP
jgi:hypothetical protein